MLSKSIAILLCLLLLFGCNEDAAKSKNNFKLERKYLLKDCLVRLDFGWDEGTSFSTKEEVTQEIIAAMKEATVVTNTFPLFFGHTTGDRSYFVFYFTDKCENRATLTESFVARFVKPASKSFPKYSIVSQGIEPGFDGVIPSGAWISDGG